MKECDIQKVETINALLQVTPEERDPAWREKFYETVIDASFRTQEPQLIPGPDGFPYFALYSPVPHEPFESFCICNLIDWCLESGAGIAINHGPSGVDWVFSYGDILAHHMFGVFTVESGESRQEPYEKVVVQQAEQVMTGQPSEDFLPQVVRDAIKRFFSQTYGKDDLGVFLMLRAGDEPPTQLVFSIFEDEFGGETNIPIVLQQISWFLPRHYPVLTVRRDSSLSDSFAPL
jgi:hypothetical protein